MNYTLLENICDNNEICIWGIGIYGKTIAYISVKCAGARIRCFCDNGYKEHVSFNGIPLVHKTELFQSSEKLFVLVAVKSVKAQKEILDELKKNNIQAAVFDAQTLTDLCSSIEDTNDPELYQKYRSLMDDELFLNEIYFQRIGHELDLASPKTFNDKINWLKIHDRKTLYSLLVDKAEVKEYISKQIGEEYVIPTIGIYDDFEEINFDSLPNEFVIKCTHDSGSVIVCKDKKHFDKDQAESVIRKALSTNLYWMYREWPYKNVKPRIIIEKYLENDYGETLPVYKFFCFGGEAKIIQTIQNDKTASETVDYYDVEWNKLDIRQCYPNSKTLLDKPLFYDKMLGFANRISKGFAFVRVDFYSVKERVYFSEITFYSDAGMAGFVPEEWNDRLGKMIRI